MTNEQLAALALAAINDADARVVLADAIEESGMDDADMIARVTLAAPKFVDEWSDLFLWREMPWYPRAIAAVLLFGDLPTRWELAERCRETHREMMRRWARESEELQADAIARGLYRGELGCSDCCTMTHCETHHKTEGTYPF